MRDKRKDEEFVRLTSSSPPLCSIPAAGAVTGKLWFDFGACCGDIHDGILLEVDGDRVVISEKGFNQLKMAVDEYYHQRCPACGFGHKR